MRQILKTVTYLLMVAILIGCELSSPGQPALSPSLTVWHSYTAGGEEERVFEQAIEGFRAARADITVRIVRIPYSQIVPQFITAAQGGEAPDLVRLADSHLTKLGHITVGGVPLLEDFRAHLKPAEAARFIPSALAAMRMDNRLLALPASQGAMSLLYNPALFTQYGIAPPTADWTIDDLLKTAEAFRDTPVDGLSIPLRWSLWVFPFLTAYGGDLFDQDGRPRFLAPGMADALKLTRAMEFDRALITSTNRIDTAKTLFSQSRAAMIIEGAWNITDYEAAGVAVRQSLLPYDANSGRRMRTLNSIIGWGLSAQSVNKIAAADLALWLTSDPVQRDFLDHTHALPTTLTVAAEARNSDQALISGFMAQTNHAFTLPMKRGVQQIFPIMDTAIQLIATREQSAREALEGAQQEMLEVMTP